MKSLSNYILESQQVTLDSDGKEHGFDYVDLGLPSGTMWATCNVGADKPEDGGLLFQFGRIDGYKYDAKNDFYTPDDNENITGDAYINPTTSGIPYDADKILSFADDAVHAKMGGKWKMPTKADLKELYDNTTRKVVTINGNKGMLFTSKLNDKSIFVAFTGYWDCYNVQFYADRFDGCIRSSELKSNDFKYTWNICFSSNGNCFVCCKARAYGYSVRGVFKK